MQLEGGLGTVHERIRLYGLGEMFETKLEAEENEQLAGKVVATVDALRTCPPQFRTRLSQLQKEVETEVL